MHVDDQCSIMHASIILQGGRKVFQSGAASLPPTTMSQVAVK